MQTKGAVIAQPLVHDSQGESLFPRGPMDTCYHHVSGGPLLFYPSFAVLTDSLGWPTIENAHRAGHGAFTSAQVDGFLSPATSRLRRDRSMPITAKKAESEGKRKRVVSTFLVRFVC